MIELITNKCGNNILSIKVDKELNLYLSINYRTNKTISFMVVGTFDKPNYDYINININLDEYESYNWKYLNNEYLSIREAFKLIKNDINIIRRIKLMNIYDDVN